MRKIYNNRKSIRLKNYNYSKNGMYFITICTKNREPILSKIHEKSMQTPVGVALLGDPYKKQQYNKFNNTKTNKCVYMELTEIGKIIQTNIKTINAINKNVNIKPFVIMPDHVHFILEINVQWSDKINVKGSPRSATPTVPKLINSFKSIVSKKIGYSIWQRNYYEKIIRNENEYYRICEYIKNNPNKWADNCF